MTETTEVQERSEGTQDVPISWEALEDAFENNAPEVHSYLHFQTGEVIRVVDGIADPAMHNRIMSDGNYLRVDPVSSREQYRWMERFIAEVEEDELRHRLTSAIDGKGAFRRFKDALMSFPEARESWFEFRSERLRACMEAWLDAHGINPVERPQPQKPPSDPPGSDRPARPSSSQSIPAADPVQTRVQLAEAQRRRLHELADLLPVRDLEIARAFLEFLKDRRPMPRVRAKPSDPQIPAVKPDPS